MKISELVVRGVRQGRKFVADASASTSTLVALSLPVVIGAAGIGVETSMWYVEKTKVQLMADAAAAGATRTMTTSGAANTTLARTVGTNDAARNGFVTGPGSTLTINIPPVSGANKGATNAAEAIVTRTLPQSFSKFFGMAPKTVSARSVGAAPMKQGKNLEVALVIDVSSSMNGNTEVSGTTKLAAARTAAKSLIDTVVQTSQLPFTSRVSLVPYSTAVNVGSSYFTAVTNQTISNTSGGPWTSVVERTGTSKFTAATPNATNGWYRDFRSTRCNTYGASGYGSGDCISNSNRPSAVLAPLSSDKTTLKATLDGYTASGWTAGHLGIAWGWNTVAPGFGTIFTGQAAPITATATTYKAVIILSDFDMNVRYATTATMGGDANYQSQQLCNAMKAAGVVVYTVGYNVDTSLSGAVNLWTNCATTGKNYTATTVPQLVAAFQAIAADTVAGVMSPQARLVE